MQFVNNRRGAGLAELLVSLALSGVIAAAATRGLLQHSRLERERAAQERANAIVREVHAVLRAEVEHAARPANILGDTALDLASQRLLTIPCDADATQFIVSAALPWWSPPRAGDSLAAMDTLTRTEWRGAVAGVGTQQPDARCPSGGVRLTAAAPLPPTVPARVVPVRVWRVVRYMIYRSSDGEWWLGERSCTPACGPAQPVAGPLLSSAQGGLHFSLTPDRSGQIAALDISVRAAVDGRVARSSARLPLAMAP